MKRNSLDLLACPACHAPLTLHDGTAGPLESGRLRCERCQKDYPIEQGIPHFVQPEQLTGLNRRFSRMYDLYSWGYRLFSKIAFAYIGMREETGRREITDRLEPRGSPGSSTGRGGRVLEISIGPGVNLPYLVNRPDVSEVYGLDISLGQLRHCQRYVRKKGWSVDLFLGNGELLPFRDASFEGVFHVGGINFFNDKKAAIDEMIRVARPGTRILIADESEKGARGYEKFIPGFKKSFSGQRAAIVAPVDLVPKTMLETRLFDVWKGWLYCLEFRKPT
jgi:ubiquinone/menaquinone biosynthesis C-methylase UbiE/uncharacterized protein YbaR (Trm112 family)